MMPVVIQQAATAPAALVGRRLIVVIAAAYNVLGLCSQLFLSIVTVYTWTAQLQEAPSYTIKDVIELINTMNGSGSLPNTSRNVESKNNIPHFDPSKK